MGFLDIYPFFPILLPCGARGDRANRKEVTGMDFLMDHYHSIWLVTIFVHLVALVISYVSASQWGKAVSLIVIALTAGILGAISVYHGNATGDGGENALGWIWLFMTMAWSWTATKQIRKAMKGDCQPPDTGNGSSCSPGGR